MVLWIDRYLICCKYLDINKYHLDTMVSILENLKMPERIQGYDGFKELISNLKSLISFIEPGISDKLTRLQCIECKRLDEALVCYQNYCFYSAVVMSVSAVEYRIAEMIRRKDKNIYDTYFKKSSLGQLIEVFEEDQYKDEKFRNIKKLMPNRHKPLVSLLNDYRVFAAHPKVEIITPQISEAVLHLAFSFLTDMQTCPYNTKELTHSHISQDK